MDFCAMGLALVVFKAFAGTVEPPDDSRALARELHLAGVPPDARIVAVGQKRHALPFYGYRNFLWTVTKGGYPLCPPPAVFEEVLANEATHCATLLVFVSGSDSGGLLVEAGLACRPLPSHSAEVYLVACECGPADSLATFTSASSVEVRP